MLSGTLPRGLFPLLSFFLGSLKVVVAEGSDERGDLGEIVGTLVLVPRNRFAAADFPFEDFPTCFSGGIASSALFFLGCLGVLDFLSLPVNNDSGSVASSA